MSRNLYDVNDEPIAGYQLVEFLGEGNFGAVWKAVDTESGIYVAIKIIDLSRSPSALKELKGLNLVRNLRHPNLIPIYTARVKDRDHNELPLHKAEETRRKDQLSELIIAMGLGDQSLSARLKQFNPPNAHPDNYTGLPLEEVLGYLHGAAKGIDYLNKADHGLPTGTGDGPIIHCDIKPDNMMIVAGEVQIADCGVAVLISSDVRQTKATCSLAYSPPELMGNKPQPGSDQYSLAISYYELRTGRIPIDRTLGQWEVMVIHAEGKLNFTHPALSAGEVQVLKWATAVQPKARYASCWEMVKQLERASRGLAPVAPADVGKNPTGTATTRPEMPAFRSGLTPAAVVESPPDNRLQETSDVIPVGPVEPLYEFSETSIPNLDQMLPPVINGASPSVQPLPPTGTLGTLTPVWDDSNLYETPNSADDPHRPTITGPEILLPMREPEPASLGAVRADSNPEVSEVVNRPTMLIDAGDPLGARFGTVSLDPEIRAIVRPTPTPKLVPAPVPATKTPAPVPATKTPAPVPATKTPPPPTVAAAPPLVPRKSSLFQEVAAKAEPEEATRPSPVRKPAAEELSTRPSPAPLSGEKNKRGGEPIVPPPFAMPKPVAEPQKTGLGWPAKLAIGSVVLGTLAGGGVYISTLLQPNPAGAFSSPAPPPTPSPGPTPRTENELATALKELDAVPGDRFADRARVLLKQYTEPEQQKSLIRSLIDLGKQRADRQESITAALVEGARFAERVTDAADRTEVFRWQLANGAEEPFASAVQALRKLGEMPTPTPGDIATAQKAVADLRQSMDNLGARFGTSWTPEVVPTKVGDFQAVADPWSAARTDPAALKPFADAVQKPVAAPFAVEYLRLAAKQPAPIATLREFRDRTTQWPTLTADDKKRVQDQYQTALAAHVRKSLLAADAKADAILKDCGEDAAQGWTKLVAAEQMLSAKSKDTAPILALLDDAEKIPVTDFTATDKKAYLGYLRCAVRGGDMVDQLAALYEKPHSLLTTPARRQVAAAILGVSGATVYRDEITPEEMLGEKSNPYPKHEKALGWLKRAKELEENPNSEKSEWNIPLALLADASGDRKTVQAMTSAVTIDAASVKDDDLPFVIAFLYLQSHDSDLQETKCVAAAVSYLRLADRILERSFQRCRTEQGVRDLEAKLFPKIDAVVNDAIKKADKKSNDYLTLRLAQVRTDIFREPITAERQMKLNKELTNLIDQMDGTHPDKADAHGYRAYTMHQGFSAHVLDGKVVGHLHNEPEGVRSKAWIAISQDVEKALSLDPANRYGHAVRAYQTATEFDALPPYVAPKAERKTNFVGTHAAKVDKAVKSFEVAGEKMPFGKHSELWAGRASFLLAAATDIATAGAMADGAKVKEMLADAEAAVLKADDLRGTRRYDERRLLGCILESKAWVAKDDPAATYPKALQKLKLDREPTTEQEFEGAVDYARCLIRGVQAGALPVSQLADAETGLDRHLAAVEKRLQDPQTPRDEKAALERLLTRGEYWRAIAHVHRLDAELDKVDPKAKTPEGLLRQFEREADVLESIVKKDAALKATASFLPDYLRGRAAVKNPKDGIAIAYDHFKKAADRIAAGVKDGNFRANDSFAVKSLGYELMYCLSQVQVAGERPSLTALLSDLEKRFGWLLTAKDRDLIKSVIKSR